MDRLAHPETQIEAGRIRERELRDQAERERRAREAAGGARAVPRRVGSWGASLLRDAVDRLRPRNAPCPELERRGAA